MTSSHRRQRTQLTVDLSEIEIPGNRAEAHDIEAHLGLTLLGRMLKICLSIKSRAGAVTASVNHLIWTLAGLLPPSTCLVICKAAGASTAITLWSCLGSAMAAVTVASFAFVRAAAAPESQRHTAPLDHRRQDLTRQKIHANRKSASTWNKKRRRHS